MSFQHFDYTFPRTFDNKIDQFERQYEISEKTEASSNICKERRDSIITMSAGNISPPMLTPDKPLKIKSQFSKIQDFKKKRLMKVRTGGVAAQTIKDKANCKEQPSDKIIRTKERTVREIIEKVSVWRKLYNGIVMPNPENEDKKQLQRYSLEDAAAMVGVSKKSLDDYLLQLRAGRIYGFDFIKHSNDKVGVLRHFVKQQKLISRQKKQLGGEGEKSNEI